MAIESTSVINQWIKELLKKNPKSLLDHASCQKILTQLRAHIFGDDPLEKVNAISLISSLTDRIPKGPEIDVIFDEQLLTKLASLILVNINLSTFNSILRIMTLALSGKLSTDRKPALNAMLSNPRIVMEVCGHVVEHPLAVIELMSKLLSCAVDLSYGELIGYMRSVRSSGFFISICEIIEDPSTSSDVKNMIFKLTRAIIKIKDFLRTTPINPRSFIYCSMVDELLELYAGNLNETGASATIDDYIRAGLSDDPKEFIFANYNSVNLLDLLFFFKSPNMTFKKNLFEQAIFANEDSVFPLSIIGVEVSNFLFGDVLNSNSYPNIRDNLYAVDSLFYSSMINVLKIWSSSKATMDDIPVVVRYLHGLMKYADSLLDLRNNGKIVHTIREVLDSLTLFSFEDIKKLQVKDLMEKDEKLWGPRGIDKFEEFLKSEVLEFVREQRLLRLSKGAWVYSEDPVELSLQGKKPQMFFMILSPNNSAIIYKEFRTKSKGTPNIDKTGRYLNINSIATFESSNTNPEKEGSLSEQKLISLRSRSSFNKITLKNKHKKTLLSFYTDTNEDLYIWSDGLKLVSNGKLSDLSDDTRKQIETLADVRKKGQLANLTDENIQFPSNTVEDDSIYNPEILSSLTQDFYYE